MSHKVKEGGRASLAKFAQELRCSVPEPPSQTNKKEITSADIFSRQTVRRPELRKLVPLSDTTIYELEQKGEFPQRFYLTPRCAVWPLGEVLNWIDERRELGREGCGQHPDYRLRS